MQQISDALVSTTARPLGLCARRDLIAVRQSHDRHGYWVVKEPIGLNYFRFRDEEYFLLQALDGAASLASLKQAFEARFGPRKIRVEQISQLLGSLHESGLLLSAARGQGVQLDERRQERRRQQWIGRLASPLAMLFRGVNPDRLLDGLEPRFGWLFSTVSVALTAALAMSALALVATHWGEVQARLPSFQQFFAGANVGWFVLVVAATKFLHELGHGIACKRFGGRCHELGFMLLLFTPCLYCNVSDAWMLRSKWKRIAISAAGMYIELLIAAMATWVWWWTAPGLVNQLCLRAMFVCSVSTLLVNGNPLVRYDGYYMLSDLLEIPNLQQKASALLSRAAGRWLLGLDLPADPFLPRQGTAVLLAFALASVAYRWLMAATIFVFLSKLLAPYGLETLGRALAGASLFGLVGYPCWRLARFFGVPGRTDQMRFKRLALSTASAGIFVAALFLVPVPHRVYGPVQLAPRDVASVYCEVPGTLRVTYVQAGDRVHRGQPLAQLDNVDLRLELEELVGRRELLQSQLLGLRHRRATDELARLQVPEVERSLAALDQLLTTKRREVARLTLLAPANGCVLAPATVPPSMTPDELAGWHGTPLDEENQGALLREQDLFCQVGDPAAHEALVVVDQANVAFLRVGQLVDLHFDALPAETYCGRVEQISSGVVEEGPRQLSHKSGGPLATDTDRDGVERPLNTSYHVLVKLDNDSPASLRTGYCGKAKIHTAWMPVGARTWWQFRTLFRAPARS